MKRVFYLLCISTLISCQDKVICPAYQSTYILDDSTRFAYYSYVWQLDESTRAQFLAQNDTAIIASDSLGTSVAQQPKTDYYAYAGELVVPWRETKRTKYGIVKPVFMPIKKYRMRTAPMRNIFGPDPEPISTDFVADASMDSNLTDSLGIASIDTLGTPVVADVSEEEVEKTRYLFGYDPKDKFNVEQLYYNKYFSDRLIDTSPLPEPKPNAPIDSVATDSLGMDSLQSKKPLLKGLFKKKKKDSAPTEEDESNVGEAVETQGTEEEEEGG